MVDIGAVSGAFRRDGFIPRLQPGVVLGDYVLGACLWPIRIAEAYKAVGPKGNATVFVINAPIAANVTVRDAIIAGTRAAAAMEEHKHLVKTIAAGLTGDVLWIATEEVEGSTVRDLLAKKKSIGTSGLGARGTGNLISGVAAALADVHHGALAAESVCVSRQGRVRVTDLALAQGTAAAIVAGLVPGSGAIAPEIAAGGAPSGPADVYGVGALLYEALVGSPLERGGPRPSEVVAGLSAQIDEIVARSCHRDPEKRFGRADVLGEVVAEALGKGGAVQTGAVPKLASELPLGAQVKEVVPSQPIPVQGDAAAPQESLASSIANHSGPTTGNAAVDRALAAAVADTTEKWLVAKGKLDYGPFSLAEILRQIEKGEIVHGNILMDKDTGARAKVDSHPLLGPMVDAAKQKRDDARRAQAEVVAQSSEKKKGATLYAFIALGVVGVAVAVIFIVKSVAGEEKTTVAGATKIAGATLDVKVSLPKAPPPHKRTGGGGGHSGGGGGGFRNTGTENNTLDMSDDDDDSSASSLDMGTVYRVYSGAGGQLGQCMMSNGSSSANISIIINGPTGRVNFVKVNGKTSGGLQGCIGGVLSRLQFPQLKGGRTRAEFDINL